MPRLPIIVAGLLCLVASSTLATSYDPASHITRPPGKGPTYVVVTGGGGRLADGDQPRPGYAVSAILRPHRAADFANALYAWNTALVLQVDKQGGGPATILSGDLIRRHYLDDMRDLAGGRAWFVGLGAGISHASWVLPADSGAADAFSFLVEAGLEWNLDPALVLVGKGQYRLYNRGGHDLSGWSLQAGFGLPFPF
ncbi:MAG: hypothetical protein R3D98_12850 [Candidatus Krumholzibacteriia bacterium]